MNFSKISKLFFTLYKIFIEVFSYFSHENAPFSLYVYKFLRDNENLFLPKSFLPTQSKPKSKQKKV